MRFAHCTVTCVRFTNRRARVSRERPLPRGCRTAARAACGTVDPVAPHRRPVPNRIAIVSKSSEKLDLATRAAWLYYVAGDTQNEIAEKLQVSRPVAQRLVAFAIEKNLIRVRVDHQLADCLDLGAQLSKRYGLSMCEVVPVDADAPDAIDRKLAVAGAQVMERYLNETRPMVIAVSSGRTLKAAVAQIAQLDRPQHRLVSMVGAIAADGSSNRYDVAQYISEKTGGKHFLLPARCSPTATPSARSGAITGSTGSSTRCPRKPTSRSSASATSARTARCTKTASSPSRNATR